MQLVIRKIDKWFWWLGSIGARWIGNNVSKKNSFRKGGWERLKRDRKHWVQKVLYFIKWKAFSLVKGIGRKHLEKRKTEDTGKRKGLFSPSPCCSGDMGFDTLLSCPTACESELRPCHLIRMWHRDVKYHKPYNNFTWFAIWNEAGWLLDEKTFN